MMGRLGKRSRIFRAASRPGMVGMLESMRAAWKVEGLL